MAFAFVGIDVAFAKGKRLPIVVCTWQGSTLKPFPLREITVIQPPLGGGNVSSLDSTAVSDFAERTVWYLRALESGLGLKIRRVAIDAPSHPKLDGAERRQAEICLDQKGISCITTPSWCEFEGIRKKALTYLSGGGVPSRIPHANQLWMLVGFDLFQKLRRYWECIEVFPQAIAVALGAGGVHKAHRDGLRAQVRAVAQFTGWPSPPAPAGLFNISYGNLHDKLDAYMAAWVAALDERDRIALGQPPSDAIWIPKICGT